MKQAINWGVSIIAAQIILITLDFWLPQDVGRYYVLGIGGIAAILWHAFVSDPLERWARK